MSPEIFLEHIQQLKKYHSILSTKSVKTSKLTFGDSILFFYPHTKLRMTLLLSKWVQPRTQGSSPQKRNRLLRAMKNHGNMTITQKKTILQKLDLKSQTIMV